MPLESSTFGSHQTPLETASTGHWRVAGTKLNPGNDARVFFYSMVQTVGVAHTYLSRAADAPTGAMLATNQADSPL
jgi:hypothetical protein